VSFELPARRYDGQPLRRLQELAAAAGVLSSGCSRATKEANQAGCPVGVQ